MAQSTRFKVGEVCRTDFVDRNLFRFTEEVLGFLYFRTFTRDPTFKMPATGYDVPLVPPVLTRSTVQAAGPPEAIQDYLNDQVAVFKDRIDKKTEENLAKMIKDNNVILQEEFQKMSLAMKFLKDTVDDSIQGFRSDFESKKLALDVDMKSVNSENVDDSIQGFRFDFESKKLALDVDMESVENRVKQLPISGDIEEMFAEKVANEAAGLTSNFQSDDSVDMSFQNRTSVCAHFEEVKYGEKEEKKKEKAALALKHFEEVKYGEKEEKKKEKAALALKHFVFSFLGIKSGEKGVESRHLEGKMIMYYDDVYMRWQHTDFSGMKGGENGVEITRHLVKVLGNLKSFRKSQGYRRWHDTGWLEARMLTTC